MSPMSVFVVVDLTIVSLLFFALIFYAARTAYRTRRAVEGGMADVAGILPLAHWLSVLVVTVSLVGLLTATGLLAWTLGV